MVNYQKPQIKIRKVKLNSFLVANSIKNPLSSFFGFLQVGSVYAHPTSTNPIQSGVCPPGTGSAGLKARVTLGSNFSSK